jgi:hypothetical protein
LTRLNVTVSLTRMAVKKTKSRKKPMTLDDFATLIQKDLARMGTKDDIKAIHEDMVTKQEIQLLRSQMQIGLKNLNDDVKMITDAMVSKADLCEYPGGRAGEVSVWPANRRSPNRVHVLGRKIDIKPTHRAA